MATETFYIYILTCADGTLYTGITTDVSRRVKEHNSSPKGSKYTKARRPVELAYTEVYANKSEALKREAAIKKLSRVEKLLLCMGKTN